MESRQEERHVSQPLSRLCMYVACLRCNTQLAWAFQTHISGIFLASRRTRVKRALIRLSEGSDTDRGACSDSVSCAQGISSSAMLVAKTDAEPGDMVKVGELIRTIRVGILTTMDRDGRLHARPVQTLQMDADGTLWFFTDWSSPKVDELSHDARVSVGYADPAKHVFVTVSGDATLFRDVRKAQELWSMEQRAYYPKGPEDERLALLRVQIERAEYWIAPGRVSYLVATVKALMTGTPAGVIGENRKVE